MAHTVWILSAYDPAKNPIEPPEKTTMHGHVLACLYEEITRIEDIAKRMQRSETYVKRLLADLEHYGIVARRRLPGKGLRVGFYPTQEAAA